MLKKTGKIILVFLFAYSNQAFAKGPFQSDSNQECKLGDDESIRVACPDGCS